MGDRRHVPRQVVGWNGFCHIQGESVADWRDCRVFDISMLGIGIRVQHLRPSELIGRRISVELPPAGDSVYVRLEGEVKNAVRSARGTVRVGIAFTGLSSSERSMRELLSFGGRLSMAGL